MGRFEDPLRPEKKRWRNDAGFRRSPGVRGCDGIPPQTRTTRAEGTPLQVSAARAEANVSRGCWVALSSTEPRLSSLRTPRCRHGTRQALGFDLLCDRDRRPIAGALAPRRDDASSNGSRCFSSEDSNRACGMNSAALSSGARRRLSRGCDEFACAFSTSRLDRALVMG